MRVVIQRVNHAQVDIAGEKVKQVLLARDTGCSQLGLGCSLQRQKDEQ